MEPTAPPGPESSVGNRLSEGIERLARAFAMAGGVLLLTVTGMTVASIVGRYFFGTPISGDYELIELFCGIAVFAFFPYCHATNTNVVVDFFTGWLSPRRRAALDCVHSMIFAVMAGVIAWRLFVGGMRKLEDGETTLFLRIPLHWAYFSTFVAAVLLTVVCLVVIHRHLKALKQ